MSIYIYIGLKIMWEIVFICYINYNLLINIRDINKRTNLGNMYFESTYNITTRDTKAKTTWFIK
jgi:hypothetical protein